jgi:hypothetical protein
MRRVGRRTRWPPRISSIPWFRTTANEPEVAQSGRRLLTGAKSCSRWWRSLAGLGAPLPPTPTHAAHQQGFQRGAAIRRTCCIIGRNRRRFRRAVQTVRQSMRGSVAASGTSPRGSPGKTPRSDRQCHAEAGCRGSRLRRALVSWSTLPVGTRVPLGRAGRPAPTSGCAIAPYEDSRRVGASNRPSVIAPERAAVNEGRFLPRPRQAQVARSRLGR